MSIFDMGATYITFNRMKGETDKYYKEIFYLKLLDLFNFILFWSLSA